jgi:N-dimethylarginine dimethylaminohydrolase
MGDPTHFSIKGGANPHTRDTWGRRKIVDRPKAIDQWHHLKSILESHGIEVLVVPPDRNWPGTVYPANAGIMIHPSAEVTPARAENQWKPFNLEPCHQRDDHSVFYLSNLLPSRSGEQAIYRSLLESKGIECRSLGFRFEGEADFFPANGEYIFTCGPIENQRFVPHWGIPPWRRVYGFRSDEQGFAELQTIANQTIRTIRLTKETHYHGDTVLCAFGNDQQESTALRPYLMAYMDGLDAAAGTQLKNDYGSRLIPLSDIDAFSYAANSFQFVRDGQVHLVMHNHVSKELQSTIRSLHVELILVDVSEFLKKGGGSVKCMIGDLGIH